MATIVLSAVGAAAGASIGGGVLGLSSVVIGRAIGAGIGRVIDQSIMGAGSQAVETGKVDRFRLSGASEGVAVPQVYGRMRVGGQVIWASQFTEKRNTTTSSSGGKGSAPKSTTTTVTEYSYSVSLAIALCEGVISRVGRVWADGIEHAVSDLMIRTHTGAEDQEPDSKIEAIEGRGNVPAYRGVAYVVIEDLDLAQFGNRVPQFTFEVMRPDQVEDSTSDMTNLVRAAAVIPGTGEYALATSPVYLRGEFGAVSAANLNSGSGETDFETSIDALRDELPNCGSTSLVVSWFGNDLRCGSCQLQPKVEASDVDGQGMPWSVSGIRRSSAALIPRVAGDVIYGGTPTDRSVVEAIKALQGAGQKVMFYPFILMDQIEGNNLLNPWTREVGQPALPWRGRITTSLAPDQAGTTDNSALADAEVAAFIGTASVSDFKVSGTTVSYTGRQEFSYRRMILHYAHLCAAAGGVDAFCIGSEMRGLTQIRGANGFPAVDALIALAADVRGILGPDCKISYAADWSEYWGYSINNNLYYPLDPLWADENIDFIGIDNYMPISDWRDEDGHADEAYGSIYNLEYLKANIEGGEGYDWFYAYDEHAQIQRRTPITDGAYGEDWVWRYKDIRSWWENDHHERLEGVRNEEPTLWEPQSKPVWFTEIGCAAIDKGTNQPNKFIDEKSSESSLPNYSNGRRDDYIQLRYVQALSEYWADPSVNPTSIVYDGDMIDMSRAHVWAWDGRPYPAFPTVTSLWSDGVNYAKGHWLNGRSTARSLADVVAEICTRSGLSDFDVSELWGMVRGYTVSDISGARAALQPLMLAYGFEAIERNGTLIFKNRDGKANASVDQASLALSSVREGTLLRTRAPEAEVAGKVRLTFIDIDNDYSTRAEEAIFPDEESRLVSQTELPLALSRTEGRQVVERWLSEARVARDTARFALAPSQFGLGAGDVVDLETDDGTARYRIDHATLGTIREVEAVRVEGGIYEPSEAVEEVVKAQAFSAPVPVTSVFMDLPLITGEESPYAPHVAATGRPWPGSAAVYSSSSDSGYSLNTLLSSFATLGTTQSVLEEADPAIWDRGSKLRVKLVRGTLSSGSEEDVLNGANVAFVGDGTANNWEVIQFTTATLVDTRTYELSGLLRGQAGTDALGASWLIGSHFVFYDNALQQIDLAQSARGLARHYRIGPSERSYDDPSYSYAVEAFDGVGLRPYAPAHLKATTDVSGNTVATWVRRTRIDGDSWQSTDVPLGEAFERYHIQVFQGDAFIRDATTTSREWTYTAVQKSTDGLIGPYSLQVAQISEAFGVGLYKRIDLNE